jgi:hypothetical protein
VVATIHASSWHMGLNFHKFRPNLSASDIGASKILVSFLHAVRLVHAI